MADEVDGPAGLAVIVAAATIGPVAVPAPPVTVTAVVPSAAIVPSAATAVA